MILSAIDNKQLTAVALLDMSKAFDSKDHEILLAKLKDAGTSTSATKWSRSYLTSRYQVVRIYTAVSERLHVVSGVPQGSILGPLLFSVYVIDLPVAPKHCSAQCHVDDTKLLMSFRLQDQLSAVSKMNEDLLRVRNWCFNNQLLLNPAKTKLLICGSRPMATKVTDFQITLLGERLVSVKSYMKILLTDEARRAKYILKLLEHF